MSELLFDGEGDLFQIDKAAEAGGGVVDDPHPAFAALLAKGPVHKGSLAECMGLPPAYNGKAFYRPGVTYYSVFSFAAVNDVFTRKEDFSSEAYVDMGITRQFGDTILNMDGARHRRYRSLIQHYFHPGAASGRWRKTVIAPLVETLVGRFEKQQSVDLNAQFFARLPLHTITAGFGMSSEEGARYRYHMLCNINSKTAEEAAAATSAGRQILENVIRQRQAEPRDDLISELICARLEEEDGGERPLSFEEVASFCRLIVFAGGEATWRQLGTALFALLDHREQLDDVMRDRSLLPNAILESLRWESDSMFPRKVMRDTVLHGAELPKDAVLHVCLGAANHDPSRWENPERFDIHRPFQRAVAFGHGLHACLGQHVARQEMETALGALFDRFPDIRWDPSKPPAKLTGSLIQRGPGPLHVLLH
jgi:cytochrome P450